MSKITVTYSDYAPDAEFEATASCTGQSDFSTPEYLTGGVYQFPHGIISLEPGSWVLDGSRDDALNFISVGSDMESNVVFWSDEMSDGKGRLSSAPTITINFGKQYSSSGISITFWAPLKEWCSRINVKWYRNSKLLAGQDYQPDAPTYFCSKAVDGYDKVIIALLETNLPYRRAKVNRFAYGIERILTMDDISGPRITFQTSLTGRRLPVSTFDFALRNPQGAEYLFQQQQSVVVRDGSDTLGRFYVATAKEKNDEVQLRCHDNVGLLSDVKFPGGDYTTGVSSTEILGSIMSCVNYQLRLAGVPEMTLYGILRPQSCRDALQQLMLATGAVLVDWHGTTSIGTLDTTGTVNRFGPDRTFPGAYSESAPEVTEVRVMAHKYRRNGEKWNDTPAVYSIKNHNLPENAKTRVIEISEGTLIDSHNAQAIAQRLYNYYNSRVASTATVAWDKSPRGSRATMATKKGETPVGNISKVEIKLSNTLVATVYTDDEVITDAT